MTVDAEERHHCQETDAPVPIAVRVVGHEPERVRHGEQRQIGALRVVPLLFRSCQGRFEKVLVPNARQAAVFAKLVVVNAADGGPCDAEAAAADTQDRRTGERLAKLPEDFVQAVEHPGDFFLAGSRQPRTNSIDRER